MPTPKRSYNLYASVDGYTEMWYLEWLRNKINANPDSNRRLALVCKKCDPLNFAKRANILDKKAIVYHVGDFEDKKTDPHRFTKLLDEMRKAETTAGPKLKKFNYSLAYSNLSFDLWVLLQLHYSTNQTR